MSDRIKNLVSTMNSISGLLSIASVIFFGGALWGQVQELRGHVATIETNGSVSMQKHEAKDDQRVSDLTERVKASEVFQQTVSSSVSDIKADIREIRAQIAIIGKTGK